MAVVLLSTLSLNVEAKKRSAAATTTPATGVCRIKKRVKSWERRYDSCNLAKEVASACGRKDGRLAYDIVWDNSHIQGYDCGPRQFKFKNNTWEKMCEVVKNAKTIPDIYKAANCPKSTGAATRRGRRNQRKNQSNTQAKRMSGVIRKNRVEELKKKREAEKKKKEAAKKKKAEKKKKDDDDDI
ncbi:hypothetical protein HDU67_000363 [Dinochytrium kinnereticum]|nr:hypothetical protein HDU67_000363 [Dinochytrium kinnereticum]